MDKRKIGSDGEEIAVRFLKKSGYKILDRNTESQIGEIDIVASKGDTTVFVEVKSRKEKKFALPRENVSIAKQRKYSLLAMEYMKLHKLIGKPARFDVVEVLGDKVTLIENAFDYIGY